MAEYIEREAFRRQLIDRQITTQFFNAKEREEIGCIIEMLDNAPAADVAPVVRCKDCKHYTEFDVHNCKRLDFHFCNKLGNITRESDFCSYGERKEV